MNALFQALGLLLLGYIVVAVLSGAVYARSGLGSHSHRRRATAALLVGNSRLWVAVPGSDVLVLKTLAGVLTP